MYSKLWIYLDYFTFFPPMTIFREEFLFHNWNLAIKFFCFVKVDHLFF